MKRFAKKAIAGTLSLAMVLGLGVTASPDLASAAKKVKVKKITVTSPSGKTAYVAKGKKIKLKTTVKVTPNKSANKKVTYKSANKKIATVNSKGQVKGIKAGTTRITVTSKKNTKKKAKIKVIVTNVPAKKVKLNATKVTLAVGAKKTLKATITPKKAKQKVQWTTSKKSVATVSSKGVVKGKKTGTATITATAADGSGKKATCKVTVGSSIKSISVPTTRIVTVTLSGKKTLKAADFKVQNKTEQSRKYTTTEGIEQVRTTDGGKTYDIVLDNESGISEDSYVKVTAGKDSKEEFISNISGYGYAVTDTITRVSKFTQGDSYSEYWYLDNMDAVGVVKYSVTGLPSGLKAYMNANKTSVKVQGKFNNVENGTTAVLTGVDENGKTFKKNYVFYVGNKDQIVGNVLSKTVLSYIPDNPNTKAIEESGFDLAGEDSDAIKNWAAISGGTGSYTYSISGLPASVDTMSVDGYVGTTDPSGKKQAIPAGTYNVTLTVKDEANHIGMFPFILTVVDGVMVTGTVKDATGAPAKDIDVYGRTRMDAFGYYDTFSDYTEKKADGVVRYGVRVIPGDYYTYAYYSGNYDVSINNKFIAPTVKDFNIPLYKVNFTTTIPGATAYRITSTPRVLDSYGNASEIRRDYDDYSLYAYLKAGTYETVAAMGDASHYYNNTVAAYSKVSTRTYMDGVETYLDYNDRIGERSWQLSGAFNITGSATVQLNASILPVDSEL